ncbi:MAG: ABC transporter ATP-binding protein [Candidatus Heimdallarchaeota archaeon]|nr:ABC transporter ATP-binding protein [Candidatus Heimdallarchaeota archaeon]MDH5644586.1 ABC transporter ATP-binding protein [Candidatus Heimdallarchaeota archaeon]
MALFNGKKLPKSSFTAATMVDYNHDDHIHKLNKQLKKSFKSNLNSKDIRHNRINTFQVSMVKFDKELTNEVIETLQNQTSRALGTYAKIINDIYRKQVQYNGDSKIYNDGFENINLKELKEVFSLVRHTKMDLVEDKIEEIVAQASVLIWHFQTQPDRIVLSDRVIEIVSEGETNSMIDELLLLNLSKYFLPFSKELLLENIILFEQLKNILSDLPENSLFSKDLEILLRNFIGSISGMQESLKLLQRQIHRVDELAIATTEELKTMNSMELNNWLDIDFNALGVELNSQIQQLGELIKEVKPKLRLLISDDSTGTIENYELILRNFIDIKSTTQAIRQWVHRFEDLPSFTSIPEGVAFEKVENEIISPKHDTLFETSKLFKMYKRGESTIYALRGVGITINEGEFVVIRGPSGSGKTTLLNLLAGLDVAGRGAVFFNGKNLMNLSDFKKTKLRRKNFSFIFQNYALIPHLTSFENVKLPIDMAGLSKNLINDIMSLLNEVGIGEYAEHKPAYLSGGQMQRLGIARALASKPRVIFADEPTGDLDSKTGKVIMELLKKYHQETGITIVLVTHDEQVAEYATQEIFIKDGQVVDTL